MQIISPESILASYLRTLTAMRLKRRYRIWLHGLIGGIVGGVATAVTNWLGISGLASLGVNVHPLDLKQLGWVLVSSGVASAAFYLKSSPVPDAKEDTDIFPNPAATTSQAT